MTRNSLPNWLKKNPILNKNWRHPDAWLIAADKQEDLGHLQDALLLRNWGRLFERILKGVTLASKDFTYTGSLNQPADERQVRFHKAKKLLKVYVGIHPGPDPISVLYHLDMRCLKHNPHYLTDRIVREMLNLE